MSDIKKFLDYEGVKHLWSKINMQDYPNNEMLINVINAIDETKADRSELVQSDWNQNDETAADFIKNKPFYEMKVSNIIYDGQVDLKEIHYSMGDGLGGVLYAEVSYEEGHIYKAILNNENNEFVCQEAVCNEDGYLILYVQDSDFHVEIVDESIYIFSTNPEYFDYDIFGEGVYNLKIAEIETTPKTLDEKFIPDTIARIEDIPEQVQSDWNQSDENAVDFIKNKPFYDIKVSSIIYDNIVNFTGSYDWMELEGTLYEEVFFEEGHIYNAIFNNENNEFVCQEVVCEQDGYLTMPVQDYDYYVEIVDGYGINIRTNSDYFDYDIFGEGVYNLKIAEIETTLKTLDEKFIPDTIARRKDVLQSDWNQNDENAVDFIKNRPFYEKTDTTQVVLLDRDVEFNEKEISSELFLVGNYDEPKNFENGKTYTVTIDNERQDIVCENDALIFVSSELNMTFRFTELYVRIDEYDSYEPSYHIKIETTEVSTALKQLDEKFIPDTIARVEDIPEINYPVTSVNGQTGDVQINIPEQVQSDWNQNDKTAVDYVKNRPFYEKTDTTQVVLLDRDVEFNEEEISFELFLVGNYDEPKNFENGKTYTVTIDNERQDIVCENDALIFVSSELNMTFRFEKYDAYIDEYDSYEPSYHIKIETTEVSTALKQLDEKFIPDTIARVEDIPEQVQFDWNQNDETAVDFIKNRTHYEKEEMMTRTCSFEYENIDSYEKITGRYYSFKISDDVYSRTTDVTLFVDYKGAEYSIPVPTCTDTAKYRSVSLKNGSIVIGKCYIIYADAVIIYGKNLTKGIWFETFPDYLAGGRTTYAHVTESYSGTTIKLLDEKFIPDTIARVEDIPEINYPVTSVNGQTGDVQINIPEQVQSDWNQTDETATNYIKNKPILATSEEIKALFN